MKRTSKRLLAAAMAAAFALTAFVVAPVAASAAAGDFVIKDGTLTRYNGRDAAVIIPSDVHTIGENAFKNNKTIERVEFSDELWGIMDGAFFNCANLKEAALPPNLIWIGMTAFWNTGLKSVDIPDSVENIGIRRDTPDAYFQSSVFSESTSITAINVGSGNKYYKSIDGVLFSKDGKRLVEYPAGRAQTSYTVPAGVTQICGGGLSAKALKSVVLPDSLTVVAAGFVGSGLESVTLPASVNDVFNAFGSCSTLKEINVDKGNENYKSIDGVLFTKDGKQLDTYPNAKPDKTYTVPTGTEIVNGVGDFGAFGGGPAFEAVILPDGVQEVHGFVGCAQLTSINFPPSVALIGGGAFINCMSLKNVYIPATVKKIDAEAFGYKVDYTLPYPRTMGKIDGITIYGEAGSAAEKYAKANGIQFVVGDNLPQPPAPTSAPATAPAPTKAPTPPPAVSAANVTALYTAAKVLINGKDPAFEAYNIGGNNFFKLRDLAMVLSGSAKQFSVGYDDAKKAISLTSGKPYAPAGGELAAGDRTDKTAAPTSATLYLDGSNYFKLRDIGKALNFYIGYDDKAKTILVDTNKPYSE